MALYDYTLKVTDFAGRPFPGATPRARIRPQHAASGTDGQLVDKDIDVPLTYDGDGAFQLVASNDLVPTTGYVLLVEWQAADGQVAGWSEFEFFARAGGGDIRTMSGVPESAVIYGPPWPDPAPPGLYIDLETGDVGWKDAS